MLGERPPRGCSTLRRARGAARPALAGRGPARTLFSLVAAAALLAAPAVQAASWTADATVSNERKSEVTEEEGGAVSNPSTESIKQSYSLGYEHDINPVCSVSLDLALDLNREIKEGPESDSDYDTHDQKTSVDFTFTALWWDVTSTWTDDLKWSQDPGQDKTEDLSFNVDLAVEPALEALPNATAKYKRDVKKEAESILTVDQSAEASIEYTFWDLLDLSGDAQWNYTDDKDDANPDTEDRSWKFDLKFQRDIGESLSLDGQAALERKEKWTYEPDGSTTTDTDERNDGVEGKVTFQPLDSLEMNVDKKVERKRDLLVDGKVVTDTLNSEVSYDQSLTEKLDLQASFSEERKTERKTVPGAWEETSNLNRDYSTALDFSPLDNLSLSGTFDRGDKRDRNAKSFEETKRTHKIDDKWDFKGEASVWEDRITATAEKSFTFATEDGKRTTNQAKWDFGLDVSMEEIPNLSLSPTYSFTQDRDLLKGSNSEEAKTEVGIDYEISLNDVLTFGVSHTYSRSHKWPSGESSSITRDDSTDLTLSWSDFLAGMTLDLEFNRKASDQSGDDKGPVTDYTYGFSYQWSVLENYSFEFSYDRDDKQESEDLETFKTSVSAEFLEGLLTVDFEHEYQHQLEGLTKDTHRYLIEVKGTF